MNIIILHSYNNLKCNESLLIVYVILYKILEHITQIPNCYIKEYNLQHNNSIKYLNENLRENNNFSYRYLIYQNNFLLYVQ